jgi:hypothetical protein
LTRKEFVSGSYAYTMLSEAVFELIKDRLGLQNKMFRRQRATSREFFLSYQSSLFNKIKSLKKMRY